MTDLDPGEMWHRHSISNEVLRNAGGFDSKPTPRSWLDRPVTVRADWLIGVALVILETLIRTWTPPWVHGLVILATFFFLFRAALYHRKGSW